MDSPLVSVVCLCYNHARFVSESIQSILNQSHPRVEIIVVDDASTDGSEDIIRETIKDHPGIIFLPLTDNAGNCKAFNKGLALSQGSYIVDLAADDALTPNRIARGLQEFLLKGLDYGVHFSDAEIIDENGKHLGYHSDRFPHATVSQGDVYRDLIERYFICSPSMMIRKEVLEKLGGYDESLAYEDFDFWIRSSREFKYCYTPEPLVQRRMVSNSLSRNQFSPQSPQLISTLRVCGKIFELNRNQAERRALGKRLRYEIKMAFELRAWSLLVKYLGLLIRNALWSLPATGLKLPATSDR